MAIPLYIASLLGAAGLILLMPKKGKSTGLQNIPLTLLGTLLVASLPGLVWVVAAFTTVTDEGTGYLDTLAEGVGLPGMLSYYVFSTISILGAVRVITHRRPVYAALWFVMVVLASAGLFLTLSAEFLAFAVILIYAGAILVTYMFVIMLATQAKSASLTDTDLPAYERNAREPIAAIAAGFLMLAVTLSVVFSPDHAPNPAAAGLSDQAMADQVLGGNPSVLSNTERVGVDLFRSNPLGLELAGVILLVALVGAVVISKTKVDTEDDAIAAEREAEQAVLS